MNHGGRLVLLVSRVRRPDLVGLVRTFDSDEGRAEVRWPSGGWMIVQTATLIDPPPVELIDRRAQLDLVVSQAAADGDRMSYLDAAVLSQFDDVWSQGLTIEQLAGRFADTGVDVAVLPDAVARHEHAGWLVTAATHRRTGRGRAATVRRMTALGRLVLQQRHATQEVQSR